MSSLVGFFTSLRELASEPGLAGAEEQVAWLADGLAAEFRNLAAYMDNLKTHIRLEADPNIGRAECVLETDKGIVEYFIDDYLERIAKAIANAG